MRTTWLKLGDANAICDVCGRKFKHSELRERWDGKRVCEKDWETRHPQELIRPIFDDSSLHWTRPDTSAGSGASAAKVEAADTFINVPYTTSGCTPTGRTSTPGLATPGCAVPGSVQQGLL